MRIHFLTPSLMVIASFDAPASYDARTAAVVAAIEARGFDEHFAFLTFCMNPEVDGRTECFYAVAPNRFRLDTMRQPSEGFFETLAAALIDDSVAA